MKHFISSSIFPIIIVSLFSLICGQQVRILRSGVVSVATQEESPGREDSGPVSESSSRLRGLSRSRSSSSSSSTPFYSTEGPDNKLRKPRRKTTPIPSDVSYSTPSQGRNRDRDVLINRNGNGKRERGLSKSTISSPTSVTASPNKNADVILLNRNEMIEILCERKYGSSSSSPELQISPTPSVLTTTISTTSSSTSTTNPAQDRLRRLRHRIPRQAIIPTRKKKRPRTTTEGSNSIITPTEDNPTPYPSRGNFPSSCKDFDQLTNEQLAKRMKKRRKNKKTE